VPERNPPLDPDANLPSDEAVRRLLEAHGGLLYALGLRFCGNGADAEDLVQEVFLQAFRGWPGFQGRSSVKTWLYTIAARACQRMHRKRAGEPDHIGSLDELLPFGEPRIAAIADDLESAVHVQIRAEARERLEAAIASLPEDFRVPLILKEIVGFTIPEIARILDLEEGTIRSRVHRARLKLRSALDAALPRTTDDAPPPAYDRQTCLDLLDAKQQALDHGVPFDDEVVCERCRSVFASLDMTHAICRDLAEGSLPAGLRERLHQAIGQPDA
jgi:RNA polymerase sigma-70 factor (ECF subfamily)